MSDAGIPPEPVERKSWSVGMVPAYIGTCLWVAFFDGLGRRTLPIGGLLPSLGGVAAGSVLAYLLLYRVPASWGFARRAALDGVAGSTFGVRGALVVPNLAIVLGQVLLFAMAIGFATELNLAGLLDLGLIEPRALRPVLWGTRLVPAPVFLTVALAWGVVVALVGMSIVRWIAAIMQFFPVFPAAGLAIAAAGSFLGLRSFQPTGVDPLGGATVAADLGARLAFLGAFQWTFGFAAILGLAGADWGAACPTVGDVRKGGWFGVALAPTIVATLALLAVAGNEGRLQDRAATAAAAAEATQPRGRAISNAPAASDDATGGEGRYTFRAAVEEGLDRRLAAVILIVFGLSSLAPACYAASEFARRPIRLAPGASRLPWTVAGVVAGWLVIVAGWYDRAEAIFTILGALFAPVAGAMVADATRRRGATWSGPRRGFNPAGLLAWGVGVAVGLAPLVARSAGNAAVAKIPAAALLGFGAAFVVYRAAALVGLESGLVPEIEPATAQAAGEVPPT